MANHGDFIALSISTADGFLGVMIRQAIESQQRQWGYIISAYSQTKFRVDVYPASRNQSGQSKDEYLRQVKADMQPLEVEVYSDFMRINDIGLNVNTTGSARVRVVYEGTVQVSKYDSDQYDSKAGKEMVPVHYRV
ncbi:MAG: hypothetical protein ACRYG5_15400 [Janthinobacterium lividum]